MNIGKTNTLTIARETTVGLFLTDGTTDVLLPRKYMPKVYEVGEEIDVFLYLDHEERPVATTLRPYVQLNEFAHLKVNYMNEYGAFLDWGLEKDLFVPFREQAQRMETGKRYLVYVFLDEKTNRLVSSSRIHRFIQEENVTLEPGQEVKVMITHFSDAGVNVIIEHQFRGLAFQNQVFDETLKFGKTYKAYVKQVRPDGKVDISFQKQGLEQIDAAVQKILAELNANRGFLGLHDNSHPEDIKTVLKMSKKTFKKAVGQLYKDRRIDIRENGIYLK
ncbi:CvfB family protein [Flavobacterium stagni]|uniref:S1 RNA-binding domain-containing protein n=1 Tax=Flavobacterium stagni TaxID=2506421 RepID=A0A4Q1K6D0_9FLAO|nr:S1-like domain-containing RNA-binding protein [Flavobacterium stagni]RXR21505.1 S1 RNA-binding domain-containing protein [Flavobacterium stagni]